jgi:hypothetical protein
MDDRRLTDLLGALETGLKVAEPDPTFATGLYGRIVAEAETDDRSQFWSRAVIATLAAAAVLTVALVGYQFMIGPNIGNPAPSNGLPSQSAGPSTPAASLPPLPARLLDPCTALTPSEVQSVIQADQPITGTTSPPLSPPERRFCAYSQGEFFRTQFWIFTDLSEWPTDPQARAEAVLRTPFVNLGVFPEIAEIEVGEHAVWMGRHVFVTADDHQIYLLRLPSDWQVDNPAALSDLAAILVAKMDSGEPSPSTSDGSTILDPSIPNWMQASRLTNACRFPVERVIEDVFLVYVRSEPMTPPETPAGSVCQYWRSAAGPDPTTEDWLGNLHAFPPAARDTDLRTAFRELGGVGNEVIIDFRWADWVDCRACDTTILIGHEAATLWITLRLGDLDDSSGDVERFVGAVLVEMDAWAAGQ